MNVRMLIFSGMMTALVGAFLGLIVAHATERETRRAIAITVGSGVGFVIGVGYEAMQQNREREDSD